MTNFKDFTFFHADRGTLLEEIERNAELKQMRLWAKVRHIGDLVYHDENGKEYKQFVTRESITDPAFVNQMLFLPVTDEHPEVFIDKFNKNLYMKGLTGSQPAVDEDGFLIDFAIFDEELMDAIDAGKRDVSLGYKSVIRRFDDGTEQQIVCRPNHLAIVSEGRAPKASIIYSVRGDSIFWKSDELKPSNKTEVKRGMKTVSLDGRNFDVDDSLAEAIDGLVKKYMDMKGMHDAMKGMYDALKAEYDGMTSKLNAADARIDEMKERLEADSKKAFEKAEKEILSRYRIIDTARRFGLKGNYSANEDSLDLSKKLINEIHPNRNLDGKSADYISASVDSIFEFLEERQKEEENLILIDEEEDFDEEDYKNNSLDSFYRAYSGSKKTVQKSDSSSAAKANKAFQEYKKRLADAHLTSHNS